MTDYAKWERFDESEAEQSIEEQLQAQAYEEQRKKALQNEQTQQQLASRKLKQSSAAVASKASAIAALLALAAVDALKAKGGPNRKATRWARTSATHATPATTGAAAVDGSSNERNESAAPRSPVQTLAELSEGLEWCLQHSEQARVLMQSNQHDEANGVLFGIVARIKRLRSSTERLDEATQQAIAPTLLSLLTQTLDSIATCSAQQRRFASATDATRDLLLLLKQEYNGVDDVHWWVQRGKALLGMDAPYLASLHLNHAKLAATYQSTSQKGKKGAEVQEVRFLSGEITAEVVAHVKRVAEGVESALERFAEEVKQLSDEQLVDRAVTAVLSSTSQRTGDTSRPIRATELLRAARELYHQGLVTFREQFYRTSQCRFLAVLRLLDGVAGRLEAGTGGNGSERINRIRASAHVNIATCLLRRHTQFEQALQHCDKALQLAGGSSSNSNSVATAALIRSAQLSCELQRFDEALAKLAQARPLVQDYHSAQLGGDAEAHAAGIALDAQYPLLRSFTKNAVSGIAVPIPPSPLLLQELDSEVERVQYLKHVHIPSSLDTKA